MNIRRTLRRCVSGLLRFIPSRTCADVLLWPVARRLFSNYTEIVSPLPGMRLRVYGDMADMVNKILMFTSGWRALAWEPMTVRLVRELAPRARAVVVAGSHIGYYPILVAVTNPTATVYAYEPNPVNYERLIENISLNSAVHVVPRRAALGDSARDQTMYFDFGQSSLIETSRAHAGQGTVSVVTLDQELASTFAALPRPSLLILDAEGFEPHIIHGARELIHTTHPDIVFELNPSALSAAGSSSAHVCGDLHASGYSIFVIEDDYSHGIHTALSGTPTLVPYSEDRVRGVSFVNAFATIQPQAHEHRISR